ASLLPSQRVPPHFILSAYHTPSAMRVLSRIGGVCVLGVLLLASLGSWNSPAERCPCALPSVLGAWGAMWSSTDGMMLDTPLWVSGTDVGAAVGSLQTA